ncbi:MAG: RdgB/HAM1 family non-canonical purine NTP pyrophosphatase [Chthoniobacterales bacterium]
MKPLLLATRNTHKTAEIATLLAGHFTVTDLTTLPGAPEVEETGTTFAANAALKANAVSAHVHGWALADDSGLEVDALDRAPGVYSARYAGPTATDDANNSLLIRNLANTDPTHRTARFRCVLALSHDGTLRETFDGTIEGRIVPELRGPGGFGYDPLFIPEGHEETFGQLPPAVKNSISHRARALTAFTTWLADHRLES